MPETNAFILVVEDEPSLLKMLLEELEDQGFTCTGVTSAEEAWPVLVERRPDLVLCDIRLPGEDGLSMMQRLRAGGDAQLNAIPFVFLTAYDTRDDIMRGKQLGAEDYITKPVQFDDLITQIRARLDQMARIGRHVASQIEEAEARAELLSHARDELAETAEARIRPPAMAILGYADTLASETVAPASNDIQRRYLEELRKQALTLVQRLPEITVLSAAGAVQEQSQQSDRTAERVTLPTLMHEQVAEQRGLLALTEIDVDPSVTPAELAGDPVNLRRAVNNLLSALALLQQRDSSGETRVRIGQSGDRATASLTTGPLDPVAAEQASSLLGQSDPGATKLLASQPSAVALFAASALLGLQNATLTFALTGDGQAPHAEIEVNLPLAG